MVKMLTVLVSKMSNSQVFLMKNVSSFCYSHFVQQKKKKKKKKKKVYMPYLMIKVLTKK